jgi:hypothetical protein
MIPRNFEHPIQVGMSFGLVSGVITSLGLVVGLTVGTQSRIAVIGGIVTIAIADSLSDALGIHISEEAESVHSSMEVGEAVWVSVAWGIALVAALSWYIAGRQMTSRTAVLAEHVGVAVLVVIVSALVGRWVSTTFA